MPAKRFRFARARGLDTISLLRRLCPYSGARCMSSLVFIVDERVWYANADLQPLACDVGVRGVFGV